MSETRIRDSILADFTFEVENSRKVLEAIPEDRYDWKPAEKSMGVGQLAGHIAETPAWCASMMQDELDFAAEGTDWTPFVPETKAQLMEALDKHAAFLGDLLKDKDDEFLQRQWTMRAGDKVMMQCPKAVALRSIAIHHQIHHRGQLTVYLRLMEVAVPSTYGPTADDSAGF